MHAILAISGSHLSVLIDDPNSNMALMHRQTAITGLEEAFARWPPKAEEAHVMLAACYLLAFQSSYMPDGLLDHIISLRGCAFVAQMILQYQLPGTFSVDSNMHSTSIELKLRNFPALDQHLARDALQSLAELGPLLEDAAAHDIERALFAQLVGCLQPLLLPVLDDFVAQETTPPTSDPSSPTEAPFTVPSPNPYIKHPLIPSSPTADFDKIMRQIHNNTLLWAHPGTTPQPQLSFNALMSSLLILTTWPQSAVLHLFSPTNPRGAIVLAHFIAVRFIVSPLSAPKSAMRTPVSAMVEWFEKILEGVGDAAGATSNTGNGKEHERIDWEKYVAWPRKVLRTLRSLVNQNRALKFGDILEVLMEDPGAFREGRPRALRV
jgi:hypothetical protein